MKFRASQLGHIMADDRSAVITDTQQKELDLLLSKIQLTDKQAIRRDELIAKRDAPAVLSQGAKTYIEELAWNEKWGIIDEIKSKYLTKGNYCEPEAIQIYASVKGEHLIFKNEERFTNDYITGEPDLILDDKIVDIKSSWDSDTYKKNFFKKKLDNTMYYWQVMGYMMLCDKPQAEVAYVLCDTPDHMLGEEVENTKWAIRKNKGTLDLPIEIESDVYEELHSKHVFNQIPFERRVKVFTVEADIMAFKKIREKVELAQKYFDEVYDSL